MKNKLHSISGVTLIEILIGIVISMIMMGAMFTHNGKVVDERTKNSMGGVK